MDNVQLVELNKDNIQKKGLYCLRSMKKSDGYKQKENWMKVAKKIKEARKPM